MANNNYPQITSVTSEALQAQLRTLLPSQEGFGTDLMAQNVIVPVIDLTSAAEGSSIGQNLQTALAFGSQTAHAVKNQTTTLINNTGFYKLFGVVNAQQDGTSEWTVSFNLSDGLSTKQIWRLDAENSTLGGNVPLQVEFVVFLASGESISCTADAQASFYGSSRQIADVNGVLVNPSGFNPQ